MSEDSLAMYSHMHSEPAALITAAASCSSDAFNLPLLAMVYCPLLTAKFVPPTVGETKKKFMTGYSKPIPSIYSTVVQELLVQMHFITYHINYEYNEARKGVV
jgi:hypothetical protein